MFELILWAMRHIESFKPPNSAHSILPLYISTIYVIIFLIPILYVIAAGVTVAITFTPAEIGLAFIFISLCIYALIYGLLVWKKRKVKNITYFLKKKQTQKKRKS